MTINLAIAEEENFRATMSCFPTGVGVITILHPTEGPIGVTINSFTSVSLNPLLISFCLGSAGRILPFFRDIQQNKGRWAMTFLSEQQSDISTKFTMHDKDMWSEASLHSGYPPLIPDGVGYLRGSFEACYPGGDHEIFLGRVLEVADNWEMRPLVYHQRHYTTIKS